MTLFKKFRLELIWGYRGDNDIQAFAGGSGRRICGSRLCKVQGLGFRVSGLGWWVDKLHRDIN